MAQNPGMSITRYNMCSLICIAYSKALTIQNMVASFKKSGVYPYNRDAITGAQLAPCMAVNNPESIDATSAAPAATSDLQRFLDSKLPRSKSTVTTRKQRGRTGVITDALPAISVDQVNTPDNTVTFPSQPLIPIVETPRVPKVKKPARSKSATAKSTAGTTRKKRGQTGVVTCSSAVLSSDQENIPPSQPTVTAKDTARVIKRTLGISRGRKCTPLSEIQPSSAVAGPSGLNNTRNVVIPSQDTDSNDDSGVCCVCNKWSPPNLHQHPILVIVSWARCTACGHWVHLTFCTPVRSVGKSDPFNCLCC